MSANAHGGDRCDAFHISRAYGTMNVVSRVIRDAFRTVTGTYTIVLVLDLAPSTESLFNAAKEH